MLKDFLKSCESSSHKIKYFNKDLICDLSNLYFKGKIFQYDLSDSNEENIKLSNLGQIVFLFWEKYFLEGKGKRFLKKASKDSTDASISSNSGGWNPKF